MYKICYVDLQSYLFEKAFNFSKVFQAKGLYETFVELDPTLLKNHIQFGFVKKTSGWLINNKVSE